MFEKVADSNFCPLSAVILTNNHLMHAFFLASKKFACQMLVEC